MTVAAFWKWFSHLATIGVLSAAFSVQSFAFDYASYQPGDLDVIAARKPPGDKGADIVPFKKYQLNVTLLSQAKSCSTKFLKWAMLASGVSREVIDTVPISNCVQIKTKKGKQLSVFIQDALGEGIANEVPIGSNVTLFAALIYFGQNGPALVVNEYRAEQTIQTQKKTADCGCGVDLHSGDDYQAKAGTAIPVANDGIVVRVEQDEQAVVNTPSAGRCGRYVVVKHSYPSGRSAFTRYAQLGRLIGKDGKQIAVGQQVKKGETIGEVGDRGLFHFEIRPVDEAAMDRSAEWTQRYAADESMEWSKYGVVDPKTFDAKTFEGSGLRPRESNGDVTDCP